MRQDEKLLRDKRRRRAKALRNPTPVELPSGAYRCQVTVNGQRVSVTDEDPEKAHAKALAIKAELLQKQKSASSLTLRSAMEQYIASRRSACSPSTLRGYQTILKNRFAEAMDCDITRTTKKQWQEIVNREAGRCSAKTLKNAWSLAAASIHAVTGDYIEVSLPSGARHAREYLDYQQIPVFLDALRGTACELPALLALCSLRRSEIMDLRWQDIDTDRGLIRVEGAAVFDENEKLVYKETNKNETSQRTVPILIPRICDLTSGVQDSREQRIVTCNPNTLRQQINAVCRRAGLPEVGMHGLRHSFASLAYHLGMPERIAMEIGGWKDNQTMHRIYTHIAQQDIAERAEQMRAFYAGTAEEDAMSKKDEEIAALRKQVAELQERLKILDQIQKQFEVLMQR